MDATGGNVAAAAASDGSCAGGYVRLQITVCEPVLYFRLIIQLSRHHFASIVVVYPFLLRAITITFVLLAICSEADFRGFCNTVSHFTLLSLKSYIYPFPPFLPTFGVSIKISCIITNSFRNSYLVYSLSCLVVSARFHVPFASDICLSLGGPGG